MQPHSECLDALYKISNTLSVKGDHRKKVFLDTLHLIAIEILRIYVYFNFFFIHF